jgi:hypothetical protein
MPAPETQPAVALAFPCSRGRAHPSLVPSFHGSEPRSQLDKLTVNVQLIYKPLRRGMWKIPVLFLPTGMDSVFPGDGPAMGKARHRNPQQFPVCAQARCHFAQVIHRFVHRKCVSRPPAGSRAAAARRAGACVTRPERRRRGSGLGLDEIARDGARRIRSMPWSRRRPAHPPPACWSRSS